MKRVSNPTENDITIQIGGISYEVEAGGYVDVDIDDHANKWKMIHRFLSIKTINNMDEVKNGVETSEEEVEEGSEEESEEVVDESEEDDSNDSEEVVEKDK